MWLTQRPTLDHDGPGVPEFGIPTFISAVNLFDFGGRIAESRTAFFDCLAGRPAQYGRVGAAAQDFAGHRGDDVGQRVTEDRA
jgi:hypothetical protein